ncbi:MAG: GntR family transcriptional regulator [Rhodobacteraceae bacterium]|nr:GntR family transcriptional regulator [Paracoccaceae bacterium]
MTDSITPLQRALADRIVGLVHSEGLQAGTRLKEARIAETLGVSRSPVRAAMEILRREGVVTHEPNRGMILAVVPALPEADQPEAAGGASALDRMLVQIARLRHEQQIGDQFTEAELMRLLEVERPVLREALARIEDLGTISRRSGYGWQFTQGLRDSSAKAESYRFRLLIEPAAIMEPGFALDPEWITQMQREHEAMMTATWQESTSIALFEMNARFHYGICAGSGNRYITEAMARQNQLRRLYNYNWRLGEGRVRVTCQEHLEILARLAAGDLEMAALLLKRHLDGARDAKVSLE